MRILQYNARHLYEKRPGVVEYLLGKLNNDVEESKDEDGWLVGSAMVDDLQDERKGYIWLAWQAGRIVAWSSLNPREADENFQVSTYVGVEYRRLGVATRLASKMDDFIKKGKKKGKIVSNAWDKKGKKFYAKIGFDSIPNCEWEH